MHLQQIVYYHFLTFSLYHHASACLFLKKYIFCILEAFNYHKSKQYNNIFQYSIYYYIFDAFILLG